MGLSVISGVIAYQPSLLSYRIGNGPTLSQVGIGCLSMPILAIPSKGGGGDTIQAHKAKGVSTRDARGWFYNQTGWDHGGGNVGLYPYWVWYPTMLCWF